MMRWTEVPIHFVDFEGAIGTGVVEYGVVTLKDGAIRETKTRLCAPTAPLRPEDIEVHGLTGAQLQAQAPFADEWELFAGLRGDGPLGRAFRRHREFPPEVGLALSAYFAGLRPAG